MSNIYVVEAIVEHSPAGALLAYKSRAEAEIIVELARTWLSERPTYHSGDTNTEWKAQYRNWYSKAPVKDMQEADDYRVTVLELE